MNLVLTGAEPPKVHVGEPTHWGIATPFCTGMDGRWACSTHGIHAFPDQAAMATHLDDDSGGAHLIAWRCRIDGGVHGWRS